MSKEQKQKPPKVITVDETILSILDGIEENNSNKIEQHVNILTDIANIIKNRHEELKNKNKISRSNLKENVKFYQSHMFNSIVLGSLGVLGCSYLFPLFNIIIGLMMVLGLSWWIVGMIDELKELKGDINKILASSGQSFREEDTFKNELNHIKDFVTDIRPILNDMLEKENEYLDNLENIEYNESQKNPQSKEI